DIPALASWVAEHRGTRADILTYKLDQLLAPQLPAGIAMPCAGGKFYTDRILSCLLGITSKKAVDEIGVQPGAMIEDACTIAAQKKGTWCAMPAPHALGIVDTYYNDEDEWNDAITGAYRTLMRAQRDAGITGHVLIGDKADDAEITRLARQKIFFFLPEPDRKSLECLMEHQRQIAVPKDQLDTVFDLANQYDLHQLIVMDPDDESIPFALSHLDPDQVLGGGYCTEKCDEYWKSVVDAAFYTKD
ncbi:MAG: hypothetical protein NTZ39_05930, partial [Methanoregula sp.]|nr:hypothetical protein [Methanoregula sp.]